MRSSEALCPRLQPPRRRDDPSTYLRVVASIVRPASEPELEDPLAQMTFEELKAELFAGFASLFPELRVVPAQGQALIARTRDRERHATVTNSASSRATLAAPKHCAYSKIKLLLAASL